MTMKQCDNLAIFIMRHKKKIKKLGRTRAHRKAMLANLASSLILHEYVVTTKAKAKACKAYVDKIISIGKGKDLQARRRTETLLRDRLAADKVINVLVDRYKDRVGGFVTIIYLGRRKGDDAEVSKLVLLGSEPIRVAKKVKTKRKVKAQKRKKMKAKDEKKQSVLERVRSLRGRFAKRGTKQKAEGREAVDKGPKEGGVRSRSGI